MAQVKKLQSGGKFWMHNGVKMEYNDENKKRLEQQALAGNRAAQSMLNTLNSDSYDNSMEINTSNNGVDFKNVQMEYRNDRTGKQFERGDNAWRRNFRTKEGKDYINDFINLNFTAPSGSSTGQKDDAKKRAITNNTRQFKYTKDGKYDDFDVTNADYEQAVNDIKNYFSYGSAEEAAKHFDTSGLGNVEALWNIYNKSKDTIDFDQFITDVKSGRRANDWDNDTYRLLKNFGFIGYDPNSQEEIDIKNAAILAQLGFDPEKVKGAITVDKDGNAVLTDEFMNSFGTEYGNKKGNYWFNDQFANLAVNGEDNPYAWLNGWTAIGGKLYRSDSQEVQDFLTKSGFADKNRQNLYSDANGIMQSLWGNNIGYETYAPTSFHSDWMASKQGINYRGLAGYDVGKDELGRDNQLVEYFDNTDARDAYGYVTTPRYAILNGNGDFVRDVNLSELQQTGDIGAKAVTLNKLMDASEGKHFEGKYRQLFQGSNGLSDLQVFTDPKTGETFIQDGDLKGEQQGKAIKIPTEIANLLRDGKFYKYIASNKNAKDRFYRYLQEMTATGFGSGLRSMFDFGGLGGVVPLVLGGQDSPIRGYNLTSDLSAAGYSSDDTDKIRNLLHKWAYHSRDAFAEKGMGKSAKEREARMIFSPAATQGFKKGGLIPKYALGDMLGESKASEGTTKVNKINGKQESTKQAFGLGSKDSKQFGAADWMDLTAMMADLGALGVTLVDPTNIGGAVAGAVGSTATFAADVKRDGFQMGDLGSYGLNLLMDAGTLVPILGDGVSGWKAVRALKKAAPLLSKAIKAGAIVGVGDAVVNTIDKIAKGESFTISDARRIINGISSGVTLKRTGLLSPTTKTSTDPSIIKGNKADAPDVKVDIDAVKKLPKSDQMIELQSQITAQYRKANPKTKLSDDDILKLYKIDSKKKLDLKKKFWKSTREEIPVFESTTTKRMMTPEEAAVARSKRNGFQNWLHGTGKQQYAYNQWLNSWDNPFTTKITTHKPGSWDNPTDKIKFTGGKGINKQAYHDLAGKYAPRQTFIKFAPGSPATNGQFEVGWRPAFQTSGNTPGLVPMSNTAQWVPGSPTVVGRWHKTTMPKNFFPQATTSTVMSQHNRLGLPQLSSVMPWWQVSGNTIPEEVYYPGTEPVYEFKKGGVLKAERGASLPQVVIPDSVKQKISAATQIQAPINKGIADLNAATKAKIQSGIGTSSGNGTLVGGNGTSGSGSLGRDIDWGTFTIKGLETANFARALGETRKVKDLYNRKADALEKTQMSHLPEVSMRFQDPGYHKYDSDVADLYMRTGYQNQQTSDPKLQAANMLVTNKLAMDHLAQKNQALSTNWSQFMNNYQTQKNAYNQANWDIDAKNAQIRNAATNLRLTGEADANTQRSQIFDKAFNKLQSELTLNDRADYVISQRRDELERAKAAALATNKDADVSAYDQALARLNTSDYKNTITKGLMYTPTVKSAKKGGKVERSVSEQMLLDNQKIVAKALEKMSDNTMKLILKALS